MCENCQALVNTREKDKLEYIGTRVVNFNDRYYYRCSHCDQAFYWFDWCEPVYHHIEPLTVTATELMPHLQE